MTYSLSLMDSPNANGSIPIMHHQPNPSVGIHSAHQIFPLVLEALDRHTDARQSYGLRSHSQDTPSLASLSIRSGVQRSSIMDSDPSRGNLLELSQSLDTIYCFVPTTPCVEGDSEMNLGHC